MSNNIDVDQQSLLAICNLFKNNLNFLFKKYFSEVGKDNYQLWEKELWKLDKIYTNNPNIKTMILDLLYRKNDFEKFKSFYQDVINIPSETDYNFDKYFIEIARNEFKNEINLNDSVIKFVKSVVDSLNVGISGKELIKIEDDFYSLPESRKFNAIDYSMFNYSLAIAYMFADDVRINTSFHRLTAAYIYSKSRDIKSILQLFNLYFDKRKEYYSVEFDKIFRKLSEPYNLFIFSFIINVKHSHFSENNAVLLGQIEKFYDKICPIHYRLYYNFNDNNIDKYKNNALDSMYLCNKMYKDTEFLYGKKFYDTGDLNKAIEHFIEYILINNSDYRSYKYLMMSYRKLGDKAKEDKYKKLFTDKCLKQAGSPLNCTTNSMFD